MTEPDPVATDYAALTPLRASLAGLPDPQDLKVTLNARLQAGYAAAVAARGDVHLPEDTFPIQRTLAGVADKFKAYASLFRELYRRVTEMQTEELVEATGEVAVVDAPQAGEEPPRRRGTGQPNQGLTIPDPEGDIRLSVEMENSYTIDTGALVTVLAAQYAYPNEEAVAGYIAALQGLLELGKFEPQVTKVRAYVAELARSGDDAGASIVSCAIRKKTTYKGVKYERK